MVEKIREKRLVVDANSKGMISFQDALTKYILPWDEENTNTEFDKLVPLYPKKTYHLLLIGSPYRSEINAADIKETEDMDSIYNDNSIDMGDETTVDFENTRYTMMTEAHDFTKAQ